MIRLLKISGDSLAPAFQEGDFVIISKIPLLLGRLHPGDVIVFQHAVYGTLIKTVDWLDPARGEISVIGQSAESIDSRTFGPIRRDTVRGKVIAHIRKPGR